VKGRESGGRGAGLRGCLTVTVACLLILFAIFGFARLLASCGGDKPDYQQLQDVMKERITADDHRPVSSVACSPHIDGTVRGERVHLTCVVRFKDGTSYTTPAAIQNRNFGGRTNEPDAFSWDPPPAR
jgi:hypothetical protein